MLKLLKADGITAVASATLDFGPLAQGVDQFSADNVKITAADNQLSLPPDACLNVKVQRLEEVPVLEAGRHMTDRLHLMVFLLQLLDTCLVLHKCSVAKGCLQQHSCPCIYHVLGRCAVGFCMVWLTGAETVGLSCSGSQGYEASCI